MLNYPHNPTGKLASREFFIQIVALAKRYGFMVVNDFAYARVTFDGCTAPSFLEVPGAVDVGVEFGSFSKSYNMAGWRVGYCVGNPTIIEGLGKIKGYYDYGIFSPIQIAGIVAMRDCEADIASQVNLYQSRRDIMCEGLERMGWPVEKPISRHVCLGDDPGTLVPHGFGDFRCRNDATGQRGSHPRCRFWRRGGRLFAPGIGRK